VPVTPLTAARPLAGKKHTTDRCTVRCGAVRCGARTVLMDQHARAGGGFRAGERAHRPARQVRVRAAAVCVLLRCGAVRCVLVGLGCGAVLGAC
jgi:hypothetical protein